MVFMLVANVLNAALNWMFIYGHFGAPGMGAEGAALATSVARWVGTAGIVAWAYATLGATRLGARPGRLRLGPSRRRRARRAGRRLLSVGIPIGLAHGFEAGAFASLTVFAGWLGGVEVAAYGIVLNLFALPFMPALGLSTAANVRVGQAFGRGDREGAREAAWAAFRIILVLQLAIGLGYAIFAGVLAGLYTGEAAVLAVAIPAVRVAGLALLPDALQVVLVGCLRGLSDVWPATVLLMVAFWGTMVPTAWWLGVYLGLGAPGLVASVGIGCCVAVALLALRFRRVVRKAI